MCQNRVIVYYGGTSLRGRAWQACLLLVRQIDRLSAMLVIPGSTASAPVYPPTPQRSHRGGVRDAAR